MISINQFRLADYGPSSLPRTTTTTTPTTTSPPLHSTLFLPLLIPSRSLEYQQPPANMCIKTRRWYCCPVPIDRLDQDEYAKRNTKMIDVDPYNFEEGEILSDFDIGQAKLSRFDNFGYVRHSMVSWVRCAAWTTHLCGSPNVPVHLRSLGFSRACPGCSGYDKCLSQHKHAYVFDEYHDVLNLEDDEYESGLRGLAYSAVNTVLRTEITRYRTLCGLLFDYSETVPEQWAGTALEELVPFVFPLMCTEDKLHIACTEGWELYVCDCENTEFAQSHNLQRAIYRSSASAHNSHAPDFNAILRYMWRNSFFKLVPTLFVSRSREQEWLGTSTENPKQLADRVKICNNALVDCYLYLLRNSEHAMQIENDNGRHYSLTDPAADVIKRRFRFACHIASLIHTDPGLAWETWHHMHYYLCSLMLPWRGKDVGVDELDMMYLPIEDTAIIKVFVEIVDSLSESEFDDIDLAYERESLVRDEIDRITEEITANFEHVHDKFWEYVCHHIISSEEALKEVEDCFICMDPYIDQEHSVPRHLRPVRMPCCQKVTHIGCLQGSICKHPELHRNPTCPMCRTNLKDHGWFIQLDDVNLSRDDPAYREPIGFFDGAVYPVSAPPFIPPIPVNDSEDDADHEEDRDGSPMNLDSPSEGSDGSPMEADSP